MEDGFRTTFTNICPDLMVLKLKNQFSVFITGRGTFGNVNALANRGTIKPIV